MKSGIAFILLSVFFLSCKHQSPDNVEVSSAEAKYVLPYPVGREYICLQGFNGPYSHNGTFRYAVDFSMSIGTLVTAARAGRVVYIIENYSDNDHTAGHENVVIVMHEDSTYARYVHLTTNGALVRNGQDILPGDTIGLSGNSGSGAAPHLHLDVTNTHTGRGDQTIPFDFRNMISHSAGLSAGVSYKAFPY